MFQLALRAEPADIDMMGHVSNIVYLRWVQDVAIAHWQTLASEQDQKEILWVVLRHEINYKMPALLGDEVLAQTWIGTASGLTFERHTKIVRATDQKILAQARTLWCPLSTRTGKPQRISPELRAQLSRAQLSRAQLSNES